MSPAKTASKKKAKAMLKITQVRSQIGSRRKNRVVLLGLGLGRIGRSVTRPDDPCTRGMITKVGHLVAVEEVEG
jgi:large subunit ribosomal protein L30